MTFSPPTSNIIPVIKNATTAQTETETQYKMFPFSITINDGYCTYRYDMSFPGDVSSYDIIKAIAEKFDVTPPDPTIVL